jgi:CDP-diacylglycerol--serine O-phosphatidyltransferase
MNSIKRHIPNFVTLLGLLSGCISISYATKDELSLAGIFILIAAVLDFIDGWLARVLKSVSEFGKQLDSLADVISFGVAPSFIIYRLMLFALVKSSPESDFNIIAPGFLMNLILVSSFLIAIFAALRLARFNTETRNNLYFKGLPTPAAAMLIAGIGFLISEEKDVAFIGPLLLKMWFLEFIVIAVCLLMISRISMFSLKFKTYRFSENVLRYLFILISAIILVIFRFSGVIIIMLLYILVSSIYSFFPNPEK